MTKENKCLTEYKKLFCTNCEADCTTSILNCGGYQFFYKGYEQSREDCKSKWHDLRKDPNDLPKNREEVLLYVKLNDKWKRNNVVLIGYRDYGDCLGEYCKDWGYVEPIRSCKYDFVDGEEVIAWCELPKFEE